MNRRHALLAVLILFIPCATGGNVLAQKKGGGGNKKGGVGKNGSDKKDKANEVHFSGKIKQITPQGLVIDSDDTKRYFIGLGQTLEVIVEGEASKDFLVPGASVEFEVDLNREAKANRDVQKITIVELSNLNPSGLFPTTIPGAGEKKDSDLTKPYLARGRIASFKDDTLTLQTGSKSIVVKVSRNVSLDARIHNWRLASVGDSVKGSGEFPPQANLGLMRVVAKRLTIKTSTTIEPKGSKRANEKS